MRTRRLTGPLLVALALAACGSDAPPSPPPPAATPAAKKPVETPAAPPPAAAVEYSYVPIAKRDPFRAPSMDLGQGLEKPEDIVCDEPLCKMDLDELTVVAVVSGDANPLAMVEDKAGVGYIVRRNSKMGRQGGKVSQVLRDCIVVTSFITGPDGKGQPNKANLCVRQDPRSVAPMDLLQGKPFQ